MTDTRNAEVAGGCFAATLVILTRLLWIALMVAAIYWLVTNA